MRRHSPAHDVITFGDCGRLHFMAFGIHTTRAPQSAFAMPNRKTSSKAFSKASCVHPSSSASAARPARNKPGIGPVCGPVRRNSHRPCPEGGMGDSVRNFSSPHMRTSILRYRFSAISVVPLLRDQPSAVDRRVGAGPAPPPPHCSDSCCPERVLDSAVNPSQHHLAGSEFTRGHKLPRALIRRDFRFGSASKPLECRNQPLNAIGDES